MDAYPIPGGRRAIRPEVEDYLAGKTGSSIVRGFSEIVNLGDAMVGGERIAGFMETGDRREWYLPLTAQSALVWKSEPIPPNPKDKVTFLLSVGFGNGSPLPQPSGRWDVYCNDRFALAIRVVKHSQLWPSAECSFAFSANRIEAAEPFGSLCLSSVLTQESFAAFGPALLTVPASWVEAGSPAVIRVEAVAEAPSTRWFHLAATPGITVGSDLYRAVDLLMRDTPPRVGDYNVYFGDIHTHSGVVYEGPPGKGCGMGTRIENYEYARGPGGMDFYALTDHECQIHPDRIDEYLGLADQYNEDGTFVCLPGFEFTNLLYGHRNVYFRSSGGTVINSNRAWGWPTMEPDSCMTTEELWAALEQNGTPFITVPHHSSATSHPCSWDFHDPKYDRLVEVYSTWGSSECYGDFPRGVSDRYRTLMVREALNRGMRMGLIASSDGHDGHPGDAQSPLIKHHHIFHHLGSGRAAVLATELTRAAVFDALHDRRCYATTGVPIVLSFSINGHIMGSELPALPTGKRPVLSVTCHGANGLDHIRIVKNGTVVHTAHCHGEFDTELEWEDVGYSPSQSNYYYIRVVQVDRESAWSSPVWIG